MIPVLTEEQYWRSLLTNVTDSHMLLRYICAENCEILGTTPNKEQGAYHLIATREGAKKAVAIILDSFLISLQLQGLLDDKLNVTPKGHLKYWSTVTESPEEKRKRHGYITSENELLSWLCRTGDYEIANFHDGPGLTRKTGGGLWQLIDRTLLVRMVERGLLTPNYTVTTQGQVQYWEQQARREN